MTATSSTIEDKGIKIRAIYRLGVHAPSSPLQHTIDPSVRMSRYDELREIRKLQPIVGESERLGSKFGSSHSYCEVGNGCFAHLVEIGMRMFEVKRDRKKPQPHFLVNQKVNNKLELVFHNQLNVP